MRRGLTVGILVTLAGFLILVLVPHGDVVDTHQSPAPNVLPRQVVSASVAGTSPAAPASQPTSNTPTSQAAAPTSAAAAPSSQQQQASSTSAAPASTAQQQSSSQAADTSTNKASNAASTSAAAPTTVTSALVTTNQGGQVITSIIIVADTPTPSASASQSAAASNNSGGGGSGVSTSTIIGLSVAGGVAVLCVVGFFVWKFTRKRIGDYDNNEEIKWPELNAHDTGVPLPTNRTGGAGFDTAADVPRSSIGYAPSTAANSTAELPDPYAIPPLPHLDPNQPYRDDPNAAFYDPYRGPVPQSFNNPVGPGEVIPMTQLAGTGRRSPGPGAAYAVGDFGSGRASPGPPPPGIHAAYGSGDYGGRASPGSRVVQQGRSMSPGPQAAYGNAYSPR